MQDAATCSAASPSAPVAAEAGPGPIQFASGAKIFNVIDFSSAEPRFAVSRSYRSIKGNFNSVSVIRNQGLGEKWRLDLLPEFHIASGPNDAVAGSVFLPDGTSHPFLANAAGVFGEYAPRYFATNRVRIAFIGSLPTTTGVLLAAPGTFVMTDNKDTVWTMVTTADKSGLYRVARPAKAVFRDGYTLNYAYTTTVGVTGKQLSSVTDNFGRAMTFTWSYVDPGQFASLALPSLKEPLAITQFGLPDGSIIAYTYDSIASFGTAAAKDRLIKVERRSGATLLDSTTYLYENADWPRAVTGIIDNRNVRTGTYAYQPDGRAISSEGANGTDRYTVAYNDEEFSYKYRTVTNALGKTAVFRYAKVADGSPSDAYYSFSELRLVSVDGVASTSCPASGTAMSYDGNRNPTSTTDEEGRVTAYVHDAMRRPTSITEGAGTAAATTTTIVYHPTLNVPATVTEPGRTTVYTYTGGLLTSTAITDTTATTVPYSTAGQTRTTTYTYGPGGNLLTVDGPLAGVGDTTTYTYTAAGYLASVTNPVGLLTTVNTLNTRGQPTQITDANGVITTMTYDGMGRLLTTNVNPGATVATTTLAYDAVGQVTRITRPDGSYFEYIYDCARRVTSVTSNTLEKIEYTYDLMSNVASTTVKSAAGAIVKSQTAAFDELGRMLKSIGAGGQTTTYAYEKNSNLKSVTDPRGKLYSYSYDAVNRLIQELDPNGSAVNYTKDTRGVTTAYADPRPLTTAYVYNGFRELIRQASPDSGTTDYVRDNRGLVTQITDGRGVVTTMTYDNAGRMLTKSYPAAAAENVSYTYDTFVAGTNFGKGRVAKITSQSVVIDLTYDQRGNVLTDKRTIGGQAYTVAYVYDKADRVTQITYPSGRIVAYARAADGRINGVTTKLNAAAASVTLATGIAYQPLSGVVQLMAYGNGLNDFNSFTADGEIDVLGTYNNGASVINRSHTRTDNQNLTNIFDNVTTANSAVFNAEPAGRLQNADGPWGSKTFYYDGVGNRVTEISTPVGGVSTTDSYGYPANSNRLVQITRGAATIAALTYDNAGNMLSNSRAGSAATYTYNNRNRLATATVGAVNYAYTYNGREQLAIRQQTTAPVSTTHFIHDLFGNVLAETSGLAAGTC
jgi:YD repeat-containing protein